MDRDLWHAIVQQKNVHCNSNRGGYAWMDAVESEVTAAADCVLPSTSSYAGVVFVLTAASVLVPIFRVYHHFLTGLTPVFVPVPQRRSRRLAVRAEQAGGRLVHVILMPHAYF
jgi:hypothetical protein